MPSEPAALVIPSSLFLLSFVFFPTLFSLILLFHLLGAHIPGKVPRKILPMYHVPAPLFCVGRPSIFEARAICLVQKNPKQKTKKTQTNPTWILSWKHYFSSQWKESMGRSSITEQNADPSKRRYFIPVCSSPRPSTAEEMQAFPTEAISMGFVFQINPCPCSNPSYTSVNPQ